MSKSICIVLLSFYILFNFPASIQGYRHFIDLETDGVETIFATENENVNIECKTDVPMAYCGFVHPSGKRYSFSGTTLSAGHCFKNITVTPEDDGEWRCHSGGHETGVEIIKTIELRVVNEVTALWKNVTVLHAKSVSLVCLTTKRLTPLSYCRFEPPKGRPFNIAEDVTPDNAILGRFYFPTNMSLDRGDCAVTINNVKYDDYGTWTCGAGLDDGNEHTDTINLKVKGIYTMSFAAAAGITIVCIVIIALIGFLAWKRREFLGSTPRPTPEPAHELEPLQGHSARRGDVDVPEVRVVPPSEASSSQST